MKAVVKTKEAPGLEYLEVDKPQPKPNEVLIEVEAASICGTDIHYYHWNQSAKDFGKKFNIKFPFVIGHECAGTIVQVGEAVTTRKVGQRVSIETHIPCNVCYQCQNAMPHNCSNMSIYGTSCNGCFAAFATVEAQVTFVLPDEMSFEEGALLEPAGVAMRAVEEAMVEPGDTVVVNGCGPIGLLTVQILLASGAAKVIAIDLDEYRLNLASKLGAVSVNARTQNAVEDVLEQTKARGGADVLIETSGAEAAYQTIFDMIRLEGRIVTVGHPGNAVPVNIMKSINLKGTSIKGVFGRKIWGTWWKLSSLIVNKKVNVLDVVTHRFHFSEFQEAFDQVKKGAGKILLLKE